MRRALPVLLAALLLVGCSSSADEEPVEPDLPAESAFHEGTCALAAPDVLQLARTVSGLGDEPSVERGVQDTLRTTQDRLFTLAEGAEPEVAPLLSTVVERIGAVRIRAVGNTYEPSLGNELDSSLDALIEQCTG